MTTRNNNIKGLSNAEVRKRIEKNEVNISSRQKTKTITRIIAENTFSVFNFIILSVIAFLLIFYFRSGDERLLLDTIGTSLVVIVNTLIAIVQEIKAKRALDKVTLLLKKEVKVIREGSVTAIDQTDIVKDDVIIIERGDQVVVDGKVIESRKMEIDESLLTGESNPVEKKVNDSVLSGSFCVSGSGIYSAEKVGDESYANEITKLAKHFKFTVSPLQKKLNFLVKLLFFIALVLSVLTTFVESADFENVDYIRKISTIILSLVPQGLILMASVSFALGVYRISKIGAIIQKLNAIESFSNVNVVCTDKTGTLTQNKLSVREITLLNNSGNEDTEKLLGTYAKFSSDKNATLRTLEIFPVIENASVVSEIPFSSEKKRSAIEISIDGKSEIYMLGGYDVLIEHYRDKEKAEKIFKEKGLGVYRNILFGKITGVNNINALEDVNADYGFEPICIVSIMDIVRTDVMDAINLFHQNNIEVKILSGDSAQAVQSVAREIGWNIKDEELITGNQIDEANDDELEELILQKKIFARLKPEHKLRLIKSLKKKKIYTAMIGDGVNDLPAIKEADLGIAMEEGSSITKEIADIVLLKNKFSLLPQIFNEGNRIVNTVSSIAKLFLTKNFMVIYLSLLSLFMLFEFPLTPRRVALINLFSIGLPSFIIALKNCNTAKNRNFMKDLVSYVIISAGVIVAAGYASQFISQAITDVSTEELQMIMMSVMIIITTANFLIVTLYNDNENRKTYIMYSAILVGLFLFLMLVNIDFIVYNWIKMFYEILYVNPIFLPMILGISIVSSLILVWLQRMRQKWIHSVNNV